MIRIPTERVAPLIEAWLEEYDCPQVVLAAKSGVWGRRIYAIRTGSQKMVNFDTTDRLLVAMDMQHYFHLRPEDGGLADYFEAEA